MSDYYYHRDGDGKEWGPFTPGQLTCLLNRSVLDARSLIRLEGDPVWHTYYQKPRSAANESTDLAATKEKMEKGDVISRALEASAARKLITAWPGVVREPPPVEMDLSCSEEHGLVYVGFVQHAEPAVNLELVFFGTGPKEAHVFIPDVARLVTATGLAGNDLAEELFCQVVEAHMRAAEAGHYEEPAMKQPRSVDLANPGADPVETDPDLRDLDAPNEPLPAYWFRFTCKRAYRQSKETFVENEIVAVRGSGVLRVAFSYPRFAESLEQYRFLEFVRGLVGVKPRRASSLEQDG